MTRCISRLYKKPGTEWLECHIRLCNRLSLWYLVPWINHLPRFMDKSTLKKQHRPTSKWSTLLMPTKMRLILEVWLHFFCWITSHTRVVLVSILDWYLWFLDQCICPFCPLLVPYLKLPVSYSHVMHRWIDLQLTDVRMYRRVTDVLNISQASEGVP